MYVEPSKRTGALLNEAMDAIRAAEDAADVLYCDVRERIEKQEHRGRTGQMIEHLNEVDDTLHDDVLFGLRRVQEEMRGIAGMKCFTRT